MRIAITSASILLLLFALSLAPFVHVHPGQGNQRGATLHGHLAEEHPVTPADGESFTAGHHDGQRVDFFASVSADVDANVACLADCPVLAIPLELGPADWSEKALRVRGPPESPRSSRAPPA